MHEKTLCRERNARINRRKPVLSLERLEDRTLLSSAGAFDPAHATWYLQSGNTGGAADAGIFQFGSAGNKPVVGDWNGDGVSGIGVYNATTKTWSLRNDASPGPADAGVIQFGRSGAVPVVGDWDNNGTDTIGTFERTTGTWRLRNGLASGTEITFKFGDGGVPVVGDWDGDGHVGIGVFRPATGKWYLRNSLTAGNPDIVVTYAPGGIVPITGDWDGVGGTGIGTYNPQTATFQLRNTATPGAPDMTFTFGPAGLQPIAGDFVTDQPAVTPTPPGPTKQILTLKLKPLDINLLGLQIQTSEIDVNVSAQQGDGKLLGNLVSLVSNLLDLDSVNSALNNVLGSVVDLVNTVDLTVNGVGPGPFSSSNTVTTTPILDLFVAPVHLDLLGAIVDTSPIHVAINAQSGPGLVLGNVVTALAHLFDPPLPDKLNLNDINNRLEHLLANLNIHAPNIPSAPILPAQPGPGAKRVLGLIVAPIDLDLLGLVLKTSQIQVNVDTRTGSGLLLGNVVTTLFNTLGGTQSQLNRLNANLNALLAKVIGILNASSLVLPTGAINSLDTVLQTLALPNLVSASTTDSAEILNLIIASSDGVTPPVDVNLLGLRVTTSNIEAQLLAETGQGKVLGNLLFNVSHLLDSGGTGNLLTILALLGL